VAIYATNAVYCKLRILVGLSTLRHLKIYMLLQMLLYLITVVVIIIVK